jgi:hypothetical protein
VQVNSLIRVHAQPEVAINAGSPGGRVCSTLWARVRPSCGRPIVVNVLRERRPVSGGPDRTVAGARVSEIGGPRKGAPYCLSAPSPAQDLAKPRRTR